MARMVGLGADGIQLFEQICLDGLVFEDGFDHQVSVGHGVQFGAAGHAAQNLIPDFGRGEEFASQRLDR